MKSLSKRDRFSDTLLFLFSISEIVLEYSPLEDNTINAIRAGIGLVCSVYALITSRPNLRLYTLLFGTLFSILLIFSIIFNGNANFSNILWVWSYIGLGLLIYSKKISTNVTKLILIVYTIIFCFNSIINKTEASELLTTASANGVSVLYLYAIALYFIAKFKEDKKSDIPVIPIIILAFFSLWVANRSGVLTAGVMFVLAFIYNIFHKGSGKSKGLISLFIIILVILYVWDGFLSSYSVTMKSKYDAYGNESVRTLIWGEYIAASLNNLGYFLFGAPSSDPAISLYHFYGGNTHNSLLMLHAKFGIVAFIFAIYQITKFIFNNIKRKTHFLVIVFCGLFIRSLFDWTSFPGLYDTFFWVLVFYNKFGQLSPQASNTLRTLPIRSISKRL